MMGKSKCDVLSVLDLKDAFHSLRLSENSKKYYNFAKFWKCLIFIPKNANETKCFPTNLVIIYQYNS